MGTKITTVGKEEYRPEIDGLRAVAILAVVAYHFGWGCASGYIGVDVFFVISGFLIGGIILRELQEGRFSFSHFVERRIRRIVPAALFFSAMLIWASHGVMIQPDRVDLSSQLAAASCGVANYKMLALTGDYWAPATSSIWLLHTWSLSVEEQFYLVLPFVLAAIHRLAPKAMRAALLTGLVLSAGLTVWWAHNHYAGSFYLLPSRAWEFLAGCLASGWALKGFKLGSWLAVPALAGLLASIFWLPTSWPSYGTALPVLSTVCLLLSAAGWTQQALSLRPLRFVGRISYSLYLWHWPLLVYLHSYGPVKVLWWHTAVTMLAAFAIATFSWACIEQPFRNRWPKLRINRTPLFSSCGVAWLTMVCLCFSLARTPRQLEIKPGGFRMLGVDSINAYNAELHKPGFKGGGFVGTNNFQCVMVGNSHSLALCPGIAQLGKFYHINCAVLAQSGGYTGWSDCDDGEVRKYLTNYQPRLVILAARFAYETQHNGNIEPQYQKSIGWLATNFEQVLVMDQVPVFPLPWGTDVPKYFLTHYPNPTTWPTNLVEDRGSVDVRHRTHELLAKITRPYHNVHLLEPEPYLKKADGTFQYCSSEGIFYGDTDHLNALGSLQLAPLFETYFQQLAQKK